MARILPVLDSDDSRRFLKRFQKIPKYFERFGKTPNDSEILKIPRFKKIHKDSQRFRMVLMISKEFPKDSVRLRKILKDFKLKIFANFKISKKGSKDPKA